MGKPPRRSSKSRKHSYPRAARISETVREVVADELMRIDDDRLAFVTVTAVDVDSEMNRGIVFYDSLQGSEGDEQIVEALNEHRKRLQRAIADQVHA
ncbi:MAG: ribosome-binding factor, partial [Actinomycetota bacterium]